MAEAAETRVAEDAMRAGVYGIFATLMLRAVREEEQPKVVEMLGHVAEAVGQDLDLDLLAKADVRTEFGELFLVPLPGRDVSLYGGAYRGGGSEAWGDLSFRVAGLAAACGVGWQPESFSPDQAYLVDPDHLGLLLALLAEVIERRAQGKEDPLAEQSPSEWERWLRADLVEWLPELAQKVHAQGEAVFYPAVLDLLLSYLRLDDELGLRAQ